MSVRNQLKLLVGGLSRKRPDPGAHAGSALRDFLDRSRMVTCGIFIITVLSIVVISSVGMRVRDVPVLLDQIAPARLIASLPFSYVSAEKTRLQREQFANHLPPVYRLDNQPMERFEKAARELLPRLSAFETQYPAHSPTLLDRRTALTALADDFNSKGPYEVTADELVALLEAGDASARASLFENGFAALKQIYSEGVHDSTIADEGPDTITVFQVERPSGAVAARPVQSMEDALTFLRVSLAGDNLPRPAATALFRFFRNGVHSNLAFDRLLTAHRTADLARNVKPVTVTVDQGQTIVEAGRRVTPEQYEMFMEHRKRQMTAEGEGLEQGLELFGRVLLVLAMVLASILYMRLEDPETLRSNVRLGLLGLVVIVNLALVRGVYWVGGLEFFMHETSWASTLPYLVPTALAPLVVAILIDAGSAIFTALFISIFTGVIYGNRLDLLVLTFLSSMVAVFGCRDARRRSRVVRAAGLGGLTVAAFSSLIGFAQQTPIETLAGQMGAGLLTGLLTGVAVVGLLPIFESLFKRTTDITLLELTDFNHPLLRRMQLEAPGTYHHSLVVAQLSENACGAIGANPILARVCALFHDIGKILHPSYFSENQRDRGNPHDDEDPEISAQIIRQHVTDGVELASRHHLPRAVVDVIRQHHGTTLIRYFFERARMMSRRAGRHSRGQVPVRRAEAPV